MKQGTVKWFNAKRGYGVISDEAGIEIAFPQLDVHVR